MFSDLKMISPPLLLIDFRLQITNDFQLQLSSFSKSGVLAFLGLLPSDFIKDLSAKYPGLAVTQYLFETQIICGRNICI